MEKVIYVYMMDTVANWELGFLLQAISMEAMLKQGNAQFCVKTVALTKDPVKSIGGLTIVPDCTIDEIDENAMVALILPGGNSWGDDAQREILVKAVSCLEKEILVGAICGATVALANMGILDARKHTSNSLEFLQGFAPGYKGTACFRGGQSVADGNLITASAAGSLQWAKDILEVLGVYSVSEINLWYQFFATGDPKYFMELISGAGN